MKSSHWFVVSAIVTSIALVPFQTARSMNPQHYDEVMQKEFGGKGDETEL